MGGDASNFSSIFLICFHKIREFVNKLLGGASGVLANLAVKKPTSFVVDVDSFIFWFWRLTVLIDFWAAVRFGGNDGAAMLP